MALFLRTILGSEYKIQLERNISNFNLEKKVFQKKEMDLVIYTQDQDEKHCIELKFPTSGRHPESMFDFFKDIVFLEQLIEAGFNESLAILYADDPLFYTGPQTSGIYEYFRLNKQIQGEIVKPTGKKDIRLNIRGTYLAGWTPIVDKLKCVIITLK